jgi:hypothetical protein
MSLRDLSDLILVRDFAVKNLDNVYFKLSKEEVKQLAAKIVVMDKVIVESVLKFDPAATPEVLPCERRKKNETAKQLEPAT